MEINILQLWFQVVDTCLSQTHRLNLPGSEERSQSMNKMSIILSQLMQTNLSFHLIQLCSRSAQVRCQSFSTEKRNN